MDNRTFFKHSIAMGLGAPALFNTLEKLNLTVANKSVEEIAEDENYWLGIRGGYRLKPDYINLENGYYCFMPQAILEDYLHHIREVNYQGSHYMRTVQWDNKRAVCGQLADLIQCDAEEIIITRNTTESLDTVIGGIHWEKGDEAIMANQDYFAMIEHFRLCEERYGIVRKIVDVPNIPISDEEIVAVYENAITIKTKLIMVCHIVNITGQILPIRKICDMAHKKGVEVLVDGAHAIGHFAFDIKELHCDYYGSSLHKWLSAPLGAGLLYINKEKISGLWPMFGDFGYPLENIRRMNHTGTHPVATDLAIGNAIEYLHRIGLDKKEARLRYLQNYWTSRVRNEPNIIVNTPADPKRVCGIANVGIKNMKTSLMAENLLKKYRIWTVAIDGQGVQGCRIVPNIYTTTRELDIFIKALKEMAKS
jgi:selenocysteine lyase/cysteine desulfurase